VGRGWLFSTNGKKGFLFFRSWSVLYVNRMKLVSNEGRGVGGRVKGGRAG
jgi:hypothetical protein